MRLIAYVALFIFLNSCYRSPRPSTSVLQAYKQFNVLSQIKNKLRVNKLESEEKKELLDFAEELAPKDPEIKLYRATELKNDGRIEEAKAVLEKAIHLSPTFSPALSAYGEILISVGQSMEGKNYCLYAVQLNPIDAVARSCAGKKSPKFKR